MNTHDPKDLDRMIDQVLDDIRDETVDDEVVEAAADRVWARLSDEVRASETTSSEACGDYRAMIPDYLEGSLAKARVVLLEDHLRECLPCRRLFKMAKEGETATPAASTVASPRRRGRAVFGWAVAAAATILLAVVLVPALLGPAAGTVEVASLEGDLYRITPDGTVPVTLGEKIELTAVETVRTSRDGHALLRLADGSVVEMRERSEMGLTHDRSILGMVKRDATVRLARGSVIVEASDQGSGHLWVDTDDCEVAVTGTVFSVNHGTKGSRVSVIEGEVQVRYGDNEDVLHAGDQITTHPHLGAIPVAQEIAWSQNIDKHLELLEEFKKLGDAIDEAIELPGLRYSTDLLDRVPAGTMMFAAVPNVGGTLSDAYDVVKTKVGTNPILKDWWQTNVVETGGEPMVEMAIEKIRTYSEQLGPEILLTLQIDDINEEPSPLIIAELKSAGEFRSFVESELAQLDTMTEERPAVVFLDAPTAAATGGGHDKLFIYIRDDVMFASPFAPAMHRIAGPTLAGSSFHQRLAQTYRDGVQWMVGVDLQSLISRGMADNTDAESTAMLQNLGILDVKHLIAERRDFDNIAEHRAVVTFDQPRHGIVAWLAEPAPMGALDFISPDAAAAVAFVTKDPATMIDELISYIPSEEFATELANFEAEAGISVRDDLAAPLGGEIAVAIDGPLLPKPSWKAILEVYDAARLQSTIEWIIDRCNQELGKEGRSETVGIARHAAGDRTYYSLLLNEVEVGVHYAFVDGYVVAAASRPLIDQAIQIRQLGATLQKSPGFKALLPKDGRANFSAVAYQNLGPVLSKIGDAVSGIGAEISPEQQAIVERLAGDHPASLVFAYGDPERITLVANTEGGLFGSGFGSLFNLSALDTLERLGHEIQK